MTLRTAALLAFIGSALLALVLIAGFANDLLAVGRGLLGPRALVVSFVHALAAGSLAVFFLVFHRSRP
jgi:hypothetical protein